jgi:hypothetical protein
MDGLTTAAASTTAGLPLDSAVADAMLGNSTLARNTIDEVAGVYVSLPCRNPLTPPLTLQTLQSRCRDRVRADKRNVLSHRCNTNGGCGRHVVLSASWQRVLLGLVYRILVFCAASDTPNA